MRYWTLLETTDILAFALCITRKLVSENFLNLNLWYHCLCFLVMEAFCFKSLLQSRLNLDDCKIHILVYAFIMSVLCRIQEHSNNLSMRYEILSWFQKGDVKALSAFHAEQFCNHDIYNLPCHSVIWRSYIADSPGTRCGV